MTSSPLKESEEKSIFALLDALIPADPERGLPSGAQIEFQVDASFLEGVKMVELASQNQFGKAFHALSLPDRLSLLKRLDRTQRSQLMRLAKRLAEAYYLRREVAKVIGARAEPPFPLGSHVEDCDWILLEPVLLKGKIYRDV